MAPFACIFVPDFPVQAVLRAEPQLRPHPVAVLEGKAPLQKVLAGNEAASRMGIEPGMTRVQVETCGDLALRARSSVAETEAHAALLECAQSFSPRVEDSADDTLLLDLAGLETLFGPPPKIAHDLAHRISALGLEANVAAASNVDTAMLAARGFSGVTVIPAGQEANVLGSLPVSILFAGRDMQSMESARMLETLARWGIHHLHALAALPEVALSERLGQQGVFLQQLARGATFRDLVPVEEPPVFEKTVELEYPLVLLEPLALLLNQMLEEICGRLAAYALATQELVLQLELADRYFDGIDTGGVGTAPATPDEARQSFTRTLRLPVPLLDPKVFLKLLQLDLNANPPGAPIRKIHLSAKPSRPRAAQGGLFLPPSPEPEKLELTLARITGIVGGCKCGSVELLDTHRPESFRMQHFAPRQPETFGKRETCGAAEIAALPPGRGDEVFSAESKARLFSEQQAGNAQDGNLVTALRIFRPPVAAVVTIREGRPAHILCPKRETLQGEILWTAGPWRSSGDWWESDGWSRDEWDIAVQEKSGIALYRLVRDLLAGKWLVEGSYD